MNGRRSSANPRRWRGLGWVALLAMALQPGLVLAQASPAAAADRLKAGDTVVLVVPGRPELDQEMQLDASGQVDVSQVGAVQLAGLTPDEASQLIKQKLRLFYPTLDAVELSVAGGDQIRVYVMGAVHQRGAISFTREPSLWAVLRAIGGVEENANLREARVIRDREGGLPEVFPLDLRGVVEGTDPVEFTFRDGDTLVVPTLVEGIPGTDAAEGVKVFGSVALPTVVPIESGTPLLDVLMLAGAPTEEARMSKVSWVHHEGDRVRAQVVDLKLYLLEGNPAGNPLVYPGDTVHVEYDRPSWVQRNVPFLLGSLAAIATVALAYDRVISEN